MTEEQLQTMRDLLKVQGGMANLWLEPDLPDKFKELLAYVDFLQKLIHDLKQESTAYQRGLELGMAAERERCVRFLEQEAACCQADQDPEGALLCRALAERLPMTAAQQVAFWDRALGEAAKWLAGEQENRTS